MVNDSYPQPYLDPDIPLRGDYGDWMVQEHHNILNNVATARIWLSDPPCLIVDIHERWIERLKDEPRSGYWRDKHRLALFTKEMALWNVLYPKDRDALGERFL